jgi:hypothetical protein
MLAAVVVAARRVPVRELAAAWALRSGAADGA